ncbi:MAG: hypothetical protein ABI663_17935 [Chryseolinea sp.]
MFRRYRILLFILFLPAMALCQISREHLAERSIQKKKWDQAYSQLKKAMHKDSFNVAAQHVMTHYFFDQQNPAYQIDSAYRYNMMASLSFTMASSRQRDRLKRFPIDSLILQHLRERIDSAAFQRAKEINTERAYLDFLSGFPSANQRDHAVELRNEAAYQDALHENTYVAFEDYLKKYPESIRTNEAKALYEKLLYRAKTADQHLSSYKTFLEAYPRSPYRHDAELNIFEISTATGTAESYRAFLHDYPQSFKAKQALNILYHISSDADLLEDALLQTDSLVRVSELEKHYVVPILHAGSFGFMNDIGEEIIQPQSEEIADDYRCGDIMEDVLVLSDKIISRSGSVIFSDAAHDVTDLGSGFLKIQIGDCVKVIHKSGFIVGDSCITDARLLSGKLLAIKKEDQWSVWTLSGRMLVPFSWDEISTVEDVILFKNGDKTKLATIQSVARVADHQTLQLSDAFDDAKAWSQHLLQVQSGEFQGVLNQRLDVFIRFDKHKLTNNFFGTLAISPFGSSIFNKRGEESAVFKQVRVSIPWTSVKANTLSWKLFNPVDLTFQSPVYDTIHFVGPFAVGSRPDSITIHFNPYYSIDFSQPAKLEFIPGQDSTAFLLVEHDEIKELFDGEGRKLFAVVYDRIQYAGQGMFIVHKKDKKGLVGSDGKLLLPIEFDAIGSVKNNTVSVLKAMKFGLFDCKKKKLIKPEYVKNIVPYTADKLVVFKDGFNGFVGWDNKPLSKFEFEEVRYWNDTAAMVKSNFMWRLYDIRSGKVLIDRIKDYSLIQDTQQEKIAVMHQDNTYGVIHNHKGAIIPANFSDIVNVGSRELPMYFTEKHVEEASIFVVIYYDHAGRMLRKEVYEQDDYEKIYCSDN